MANAKFYSVLAASIFLLSSAPHLLPKFTYFNILFMESFIRFLKDAKHKKLYPTTVTKAWKVLNDKQIIKL